MDNEKEIPFGAFDSELMHQEITIPEGFEATIEGNKIILKKTESDDVKIRKELIKVFSNREKYLIDQSFGDITVPEILAWLEKQGEQKPFDYENATIVQKDFSPKEEPKFNVGDWVIWDNKVICYIDSVYQGKETLMYTIVDTNNMIRSYSVKSFDNNARLWTIQDAKDGDVLVYGDNPDDHHVEIIMLFKLTRNIFSAFTHFHIYDDVYGVNDWCDCRENAHPATNEQCDLLFQKMHEAGYEWDADKKELKKIEQKPTEWGLPYGKK